MIGAALNISSSISQSKGRHMEHFFPILIRSNFSLHSMMHQLRKACLVSIKSIENVPE